MIKIPKFLPDPRDSGTGGKTREGWGEEQSEQKTRTAQTVHAQTVAEPNRTEPGPTVSLLCFGKGEASGNVDIQT